jgi:hypothetical protein
MLGRLAELYVDIVAKDHTAAGMDGVRAKAMAFAGSMRHALTIPAAIVGGVGGLAVTKVLYDAVQKAGDLNETLSKTGVVFGGSASTVIADADAMAKKFGTVKGEYLEAAAAIGNVLQASGLDKAASGKLSITLARRADDLASRDNLQFGDAVQKIMSGVVGEAEPLRRHGILLSEEAVKAEAAASGLAENVKAMTDAEKVQARVNLILKQSANAEGDHERTLGGLANQQKKLAGDWENLQTAIGSELVPAGLEAIDMLRGLAGSITGVFGSDTQVQVQAFGAAVESLIAQFNAWLMPEAGSNASGAEQAGHRIGQRGLSEIVGSQDSQTEAQQWADFYASTGFKPTAEHAKMIAKLKPAEQPTPGDDRPTGMPVDISVWGDVFAMKALQMEQEIRVGAAGMRNDKSLVGARADLASQMQSREDRLAQGGLLGSQESAIAKIQDQALNDLPRKQLEAAEKQVRILEGIAKSLDSGNVWSPETAGLTDMVLRGPE